jgi:excisionase family DNA binding protein
MRESKAATIAADSRASLRLPAWCFPVVVCANQIRKATKTMQNLLTLEQVAELLSVHPMTVRRRTAKTARPRLPFLRLGDKLRFRESDIEAYLAQCVQTPSAMENRIEAQKAKKV